MTSEEEIEGIQVIPANALPVPERSIRPDNP